MTGVDRSATGGEDPESNNNKKKSQQIQGQKAAMFTRAERRGGQRQAKSKPVNHPKKCAGKTGNDNPARREENRAAFMLR